MLIIDRQNRLLDILRQRKTAELDELAAELAVSSSTVRRDLDMLADRGLIENTRGGAIYRERPVASPAFDQRMHEQVPQKQAIGRAAAAMVKPNMTVFLDGGTTMHFTALAIEARPLQIITHSLTIAHHFANDERVELLVLGGALYPRTGVLIGPIALQAIREVHADLFLFCAAGIFEGEAFNSNLDMAAVEKGMLRQSAHKVLLADSDKFGKKSLARICRLDEVDQTITDDGIGRSWIDQMGQRLIVAKEPAKGG